LQYFSNRHIVLAAVISLPVYVPDSDGAVVTVQRVRHRLQIFRLTYLLTPTVRSCHRCDSSFCSAILIYSDDCEYIMHVGRNLWARWRWKAAWRKGEAQSQHDVRLSLLFRSLSVCMSVCRSSSVHSSLNYSTLRRWIRISSRTFRSPRLPSRGVLRVVKKKSYTPLSSFSLHSLPINFFSPNPFLPSPKPVPLSNPVKRSEGAFWAPGKVRQSLAAKWFWCGERSPLVSMFSFA